jgi:hypothetical protein
MLKQEIVRLLEKSYGAFADEIEVLNEQEFRQVAHGKWNASQHADHLNRSLLPLIIALKLPLLLTRMIFGKARRVSLSYGELVARYQAKIASGSKAVHPFIPSKFAFKSKESLLKKLDSNLKSLIQQLQKFQEEQFDEIMLPHPILEKITLREMLYFTIYHAEHHRNLLLKNLEN